MNNIHNQFLPKWWYFILTIIGLLGCLLVILNPQMPEAISRLSQKVKPDSWAILTGIYLISIVITHFFIFAVSRILRILLNLHGRETQADIWSPTLIGVCETILYPTVLFLGKAEFIGVWLAVKVAGQWVRWKGDLPQTAERNSLYFEALNEGRRRFNAFLVGNALSIIAGMATFGALKIWAFTSC